MNVMPHPPHINDNLVLLCKVVGVIVAVSLFIIFLL